MLVTNTLPELLIADANILISGIFWRTNTGDITMFNMQKCYYFLTR